MNGIIVRKQSRFKNKPFLFDARSKFCILRLQDIDSCSKATWFYNRKIVVIKKMLQNFLNEENDD